MAKNEQKMRKKLFSQTTTIGGAITIFIVLFSLIVMMPKSSTSNMKKIVLIGDSITESWKGYSPEFFTENPYLINKGVGGETTPQILDRFNSDVVSLEPEFVIILAGINDIAQNTGYISVSETFTNIVSMVEIANSHNISPILCSVLPASKIVWKPEIKSADLVIELNEKLEKYCIENNTVYIDYFSSMVGEKKELRSDLTYDGVHPDKKGYLIMEKILLETIQKKL
tara:strand:+ start:73 stop:753 length:681 start_codon:yes stop_codon:yes gene_type:complete